MWLLNRKSAIGLTVILLLTVGFMLYSHFPRIAKDSAPQAQTVKPTPDSITIAAVGDSVCTPKAPVTPVTCRMNEVASSVKAVNPLAVLLLGDLQYEKGKLEDFNAAFDTAWGSQAGILKPTPGNHEYNTKNAAGYFEYFKTKNVETGESGKGYYAFSVGQWRIISLNSNCEAIGGCDEGSAQANWLAAELQNNPVKCTIAYWHHPVFSSGPHGIEPGSKKRGLYFWQLLEQAGAEVVLSGHDHNYERFAAQLSDGTPDAERGIREFVVGTGGKNLYPILRPLARNSEFNYASSFGYLRLGLSESSYTWEFVSIDNKVLDSGSGMCH